MEKQRMGEKEVEAKRERERNREGVRKRLRG